ncbi:TetR/AcrR family transcriptional regulator [Lentzea sp. NPDC059081]|uniref:TetR/AcrR family transcriptional regulator n=1 Tax=Lentzea sp. NPDC059081 TaxID=3346719 RepID=UPI00367B686E
MEAAATDEFSANGFASGRVDRIAEAANVNKSSIYSYFGTKEGLFGPVLERVATEHLSAV